MIPGLPGPGYGAVSADASGLAARRLRRTVAMKAAMKQSVMASTMVGAGALSIQKLA